jgi:ATP-dependent metalloprotease FtsH
MVLLSKIGGFFARHWRAVIIWTLITAGFLFFVLPNFAEMLPFFGWVALILFNFLYAILFMIVQFGFLLWFLSRGRTYWIMPGETGITFKDYKGQKEILEQARRYVTLLRGVKEFKEMGGEVIRGVLLVGPPGTGKSYLAQAIATEAGVPFGYASGTSFMNMFWGMDVLTIWRLYRKARNLARKHGACILMIDEIDAIGASRFGAGQNTIVGGLGGFFGGMRTALNQLLIEMDPPRVEESWTRRLLRKLGFKIKPATRPVVLTMGATNIPEILDPALLRPGRFDRKIVIDPPDFEGRMEIIEYYLAKVRHQEMPIERMAHDTIGYTPVTIKTVINEAVVIAHFEGRDAITYEDFTKAREMHELGISQPIKRMAQDERRMLAYHEAGHAFAYAKLLPHKVRLTKVTILRHGRALGFAQAKPAEERYTDSREDILAEIQVALASRAAEELFLGSAYNGVTSDFQHATQLAQAYLGLWGMDGSFVSSLATGQPPDPKAVEALLEEQYQEVKQLLANNADSIHAIAERLLEKNELYGDEVTQIIREVEAKRPPIQQILNEQNRRTAYHEAGHVIAQLTLFPHEPIVRVSIVRKRYVGGRPERTPLLERPNYLASRDDVLREIQTLLAGRAAEELFLGNVFVGSSDDLRRATALARAMITTWGMGGSLYYELPEERRDGEAKEIRQRVERLLEEQYEAVKRLLREREDDVHALVRELLVKQELSGYEVEALVRHERPALVDGQTAVSPNGSPAPTTGAGAEIVHLADPAQDVGGA